MEVQRKPKHPKWILLLLLLLWAVFLTACGREEETSYIYVSKELALPNDYVWNFNMHDGYLYYRAGQSIYRIPVEKLTEIKNISSSRETVLTDKALCTYTLDGEGGICYTLMDLQWTGEIQWSALVRRQADGTESYRLDLEGEDIAGNSLAVDGDGRVFMLNGDFLYVVGADGNLIAEIEGTMLGAEFSRGSGSLLEGEDGSVYYVPFASYGSIVYEVTGDDTAFRERSFKMKRIETPSFNGRCYSGQQGIMYSGADGMVYQYRKEESKWERLLRLGDSDLRLQPSQMVQLSEEYMTAYYTYPVSELYFLTKTDASLVPERKELVLAVNGQLYELEYYIAEFNKNSEYHVTMDYYNWQNITDLDLRLLSSKNCPDIILFIDNDDVMKYAKKGLLEDLGTYLDASALLNREDFLDNVIDAYTINGRLVCIPKDFVIHTVLGRTAQVGTKAGWTAEEAMALAEANPKDQLLETPTFTSMITFFWQVILDRYVDWENGECSFDSEEFRTFIKWIESHSDGFGIGIAGSGYDSWHNMNSRFPEDVLLWLDAGIYDFGELLLSQLCFGEGVMIDDFDDLLPQETGPEEGITPIGYPTADGSVRHTAYVYNAMAIPAKSGNKEIAWQFVEGFLADEKWDGYRASAKLSTQKERLIKRAERMKTIVYKLNDKGEHIMTYHLGAAEPKPAMEQKGGVYFEGESYSYYYLLPEQVDTVLEIIENIDFTSTREGVRYDVISILLEELGPYIEGQKSLEECTRILQNRVRNLVQENM